jgi:hypothetical protein
METTETKPTFVVKEIGGEEKSAAEREAEVLRLAEEQQAKAQADADAQNQLEEQESQKQQQQQKPEITEDVILGYVKEKYQREVATLDELFAEKQQEVLPEDVAAFAKYKKETGRGMEDFIKLQQSVDDMPEDSLIKSYLLEKEEGLDAEDIDYMIESEYSYDEDLDDDKEIAAKKLKKKKVLTEAKKYFNEKKEQYRIPLESKENSIPNEEIEEFKSYKERLQVAKTEQEVIQKQSQHFEQKTTELFSPEFKGFKFSVDGQDVVVPFGDPNELKTLHSTPRNFINKYLDQETGMLKDVEGYHKALAAAMNPEKLATYFYELGKAKAIESLDKETKNINMTTRNNPQTVRAKGFTVREVPDKK